MGSQNCPNVISYVSTHSFHFVILYIGIKITNLMNLSDNKEDKKGGKKGNVHAEM